MVGGRVRLVTDSPGRYAHYAPRRVQTPRGDLPCLAVDAAGEDDKTEPMIDVTAYAEVDDDDA